MKVLHLSHSDIAGGAARAAYRIHRALLSLGIESRMKVNQATSGDWTVQSPTTKLERISNRIRSYPGGLLKRLQKTENHILNSPAFFPSNWPQKLNKLDVDLINLHWVNSEMMSIGDIGRLQKPIVWTLHDMWAFCGAEHYTDDSRWREGYRKNNRPLYESGFDLNKWTWKRKKKYWNRPIHIVTPSRWLGECVRESVLMADWPVVVIPYAIDVESWKPIKKRQARELLNLPLDKKIILFSAVGGIKDPRKGFNFLQEALLALHDHSDCLQLLVIGQRAPKEPLDLGFPVHFYGNLHDDLTIQILYNAADAFVLPSRQDNLPNTCIESLACGTPVVAFNIGGMPDMVEHQVNGYLAVPFESEDLALGIKWILDNPKPEELRKAAREKINREFNNLAIAEKYIELYRKILNA